jgi:hypothetical protein
MRRQAIGKWWHVLALLGASSALIAGCGATDPPVRAQTTTARTTATATATAIQCQPGMSALPQGWSWYHDTRYPFQIAFPPGWRSGSFEYIPEYTYNGGPVGQPVPWAHVVDFFPPGSLGQSSSMGKMRGDLVPRVIYIQVNETQQAVFYPGGAGWRPDTPQVCLSGTPATVFTYYGDERGIEKTVVVQRANAPFPYSFNLVSLAATAPQDSVLFADILNTFFIEQSAK